jgi:S-adenosylmethionine:tRNA ribosyltransferase-isomerase
MEVVMNTAPASPRAATGTEPASSSGAPIRADATQPLPGSPASPRAATRLLVVDPQLGAARSSCIGELPSFLREHDLVVLNDAATLPASLQARTQTGAAVELRLLGPGEGSVFSAVLFGAGDYHIRTEHRPAPPELEIGERLAIGSALQARVLGRSEISPRLLEVQFDREGAALWRALYAHGRPVQYAHQSEALALWSVQTLYATRPWAAEMPSAGRPLSAKTLLAIKRRGIGLASLTHAAGLSATGDPVLDRALPLPERYEIPSETAQAITETRARGGRVIAVGTTVVRALESAALRGRGEVLAGAAVSSLRLDPSHRLLAVSGLLTGVHSPEESHYDLLGAFVDATTLQRSLDQARALGYRNHEFGDASLILPGALARTPSTNAPPSRPSMRPSRAHAGA